MRLNCFSITRHAKVGYQKQKVTPCGRRSIPFWSVRQALVTHQRILPAHFQGNLCALAAHESHKAPRGLGLSLRVRSGSCTLGSHCLLLSGKELDSATGSPAAEIRESPHDRLEADAHLHLRFGPCLTIQALVRHSGPRRGKSRLTRHSLVTLERILSASRDGSRISCNGYTRSSSSPLHSSCHDRLAHLPLMPAHFQRNLCALAVHEPHQQPRGLGLSLRPRCASCRARTVEMFFHICL